MNSFFTRVLGCLALLLTMASANAATWDQTTGILKLNTVQFPVTQRAFANVTLLLKPDNTWIVVGTSTSDFTHVPYNSYGVDSSYDELSGALTIPILDMGWIKPSNIKFTIHPNGWWSMGDSAVTPVLPPIIPIVNNGVGTSRVLYNGRVELFNQITEGTILDFINPTTKQLDSWIVKSPATTWTVNTTTATSLTVTNVSETLVFSCPGGCPPGGGNTIAGWSASLYSFGNISNVADQLASQLGIQNPRITSVTRGSITASTLRDGTAAVIPTSAYTLDATNGTVTLTSGSYPTPISITYSYSLSVKFDAFAIDVAIYEAASGNLMTVFGRNDVYKVEKLNLLSRYSTTLPRFTGGLQNQVVELVDEFGQLQLFQFSSGKTLTLTCVDGNGQPIRSDLPCYTTQPVTIYRTSDALYMRLDPRPLNGGGVINWYDSFPLNTYLQ